MQNKTGKETVEGHGMQEDGRERTGSLKLKKCKS